jgi:hypothetical protein
MCPDVSATLPDGRQRKGHVALRTESSTSVPAEARLRIPSALAARLSLAFSWAFWCPRNTRVKDNGYQDEANPL